VKFGADMKLLVGGFFLLVVLGGLLAVVGRGCSKAKAETLSGVQRAVRDAGISKSESLEIKIDKALRLLNEQSYFSPKGEEPKLKPPFDEKYNLDGLRTAEDILSQKVGGYCGSTAVSFAAMLEEAGVPDTDLQIVAAVTNQDLKIICPEAGKPRVENPQSGASGHVFVAVKFPDNKWLLINSIDGSKYYERANWFSPEEIQKLIAKEAVAVPKQTFKRLPERLYASGLTVFQSWRPSEVPLHKFEERFDLVASGRVHNHLCRFTAP
jgi:hypothetical protein